MGTTRKIAAIDIGTNSLHMIIVEVGGRRYRIIDRQKEMVQLGRGSLGGEPLSEPAIERSITALKTMGDLARRRETDELVAVATSAVREAPNRAEFLRRAQNEAGIRVDVISGEEEADLIFRAVRGAVDIDGTALCIDIGGGSLELILGTEREIFFVASEPLGSLRLTQKFLSKSPPSPAALSKCTKHIRKRLKKPLARIRDLGFDFCVGTSGTVLALADAGAGNDSEEPISSGLRWIETSVIERLIEDLAEMSVDERVEAFGFEPRRAETVLAGALVLHEVLEFLKVERLRACSAALREGIIERALDLGGSGKERPGSVRVASVLDLARRSHYGRAHAEQVARLAGSIFDQTTDLHGLTGDERELLRHAAILHEIGLHVSYQRHHKHSYYLIRHGGLKGFTEDEVATIANVARYFRKAVPKDKHRNFAELPAEQRDIVRKLAAILRVAEGLDRGHKQVVRDVAVTDGKKEIRFEVSPAGPAEMEIESASRRARYFRQLFGVRTHFVPAGTRQTERS